MRSSAFPFLRWAGGKRWLAEVLAPFFGECEGTYFEPFLGSGSMYFTSAPSSAILSDINCELINLYVVLRDDPVALRSHLAKLKVNKSNYYKIRANPENSPVAAAARTLFLNKTSFNGLYRVNRRGEFNVPFGDRRTTDFLKSSILEDAAKALKDVVIRCEDFEAVIRSAGENDMVYCDPAYTVKHNNNGFLRYNESVFLWADQVRLRDCVVAAAGRGATVVVSNASHSSISDLYWPYKPLFISRRSAIGKVSARGSVVESVFVISKKVDHRRRIKKLVNPISWGGS